ncbi:hypothetical protein GGD81_002993 [Rhodobium orientis]|nr:hypothetical protein [Rhodobium orientis]MBB4303938.1 hypothetical protein [Rhodobium orientis]
MADIDVETSNSVFEILENWNAQLKSENIKLKQEGRSPGGSTRRGPTP